METTIFNKNGKPVAYFGEDCSTIYTWDGRAAGYLLDDKIFGWNGRQLGWFDNGTIFDIYGLRAGFLKSKSPIPTEIETGKASKQAKGSQGIRQSPVPKPTMCYGYSSLSLEEILDEGTV